MKKSHTLLVFFVSLGCCLGQTPFDFVRDWPAPASGENQSSGNPGTVSLASLRHKIPGKAFAAFSRALKLAHRRDWRQGAKELETAVALDPEFSDAHGNLGVYYIMLEQFNQAVVELRRAIALDHATSIHHSNLALAYILLHRPNEAKTEAQTAVELDSRNARGQYLLGFLLAANPAARADAMKRLNFAAQEVPDAHLILGSIYRADGDNTKAHLELERYEKAVADFKGSY